MDEDKTARIIAENVAETRLLKNRVGELEAQVVDLQQSLLRLAVSLERALGGSGL